MDTKALINDVPKQLFVDGAWRDAEGGKTLEVTNPATGEVLARVADASPADGDAALAAAHAAQASWAPPHRVSVPNCCARRSSCSSSAPTTSRRS